MKADLNHGLLSLHLGVGRVVPDALAAHQRLALHLHLRPGRTAVTAARVICNIEVVVERVENVKKMYNDHTSLGT